MRRHRRGGGVDASALSDVLRRSSTASAKPTGLATVTRGRLLQFQDGVLEREFIDGMITSPGTLRLIRIYCSIGCFMTCLFLGFDLLLDEPLRTMMIYARIPAILWQIVIIGGITHPSVRPYILPLAFFGFAVMSLSMAVVSYFLASVNTDGGIEMSTHKQNVTFVHSHSLLIICMYSLVALGIRVPLGLVVPSLIPLGVVLSLAVALPLGNLGADHLVAALITVLVGDFVLSYAQRGVEVAARREFLAIKDIEAESRSTAGAKLLSTTLLLNVMPQPIAQRLQSGEDTIADRYPDVSVAFVSIGAIRNTKGQPLRGLTLVNKLNTIFGVLEDVCDETGVEKVKTTGQLFMVIAGAPFEYPEHPDMMARFCLRARSALAEFGKSLELVVEARVGADSGPVLCGVIGENQVTWDCWGDTVNMASRMCSSAPLHGVQVSAPFKERLISNMAVQTENRGKREIKGKGLVNTFLLHEALTVPGLAEAHDVLRAPSHSSQTEHSSFMSRETSTTVDSMSAEERREVDTLLHASVDSQFNKNGRFKNKELEAEYKTARHDWMRDNGPSVITMMIVIETLLLLIFAPLTIGEDLGAAWVGVRVLALGGLVWMRRRVKTVPFSSIFTATLLTTLCALTNVVAKPDSLYYFDMTEIFLVSFTNITMSNLRARHSMPPVFLALLGVVATSESIAADGAGLVALPLVAIAFAWVGGSSLNRALRRSFVQQKRVNVQHWLLLKQFKRTKVILGRVLPEAVIARMQTALRAGGGMSLYDEHESVSVFAMDIVGFTSISAGKSPTQIVLWLNSLFSILDQKAAEHSLDKIKTIGDAYICAAGIHAKHPDGVTAMIRFALEVVEEVSKMPRLGSDPVQVRIGVGTGPVLGGLMGKASKLAYDLFGEAMEIAEKMESSGQAGRVQVCSVTAGAVSRLPKSDVVVDKTLGPNLKETYFARWRDETSDGPAEVKRPSVTEVKLSEPI